MNHLQIINVEVLTLFIYLYQMGWSYMHKAMEGYKSLLAVFEMFNNMEI